MIIRPQFLRSAAHPPMDHPAADTDRPTMHSQTAYICHSKQDSILARGFLELLNLDGWMIHADLSKAGLPDQPNHAEIDSVQQQILKRDYFLLLATSESMTSPWCLWQLGYAAAKKPAGSILIVPTSGVAGTQGGGFLRAYRHIDLDARNHLQVVEPGLSGQGRPVRMLSKESRLSLVHGRRAQSGFQVPAAIQHAQTREATFLGRASRASSRPR